ncbi:immunoglobulin I-set domain-containing protein [Aphelenchoides avenae]|nr:immunoglobulin I-set domain-containing protein [Aphelenchus avenae]
MACVFQRPAALRPPPLLLFVVFAALLLPHPSSAWSLRISPPREQLSHRKAGENLLLVCEIEGIPAAEAKGFEVRWITPMNGSSNLARVVVNQHDMSSSLIFIEPSADHSGQYECKAAVSGEDQSKAVNVTFLRSIEFINPQTDQHPEEGTEAVISCAINGSAEIFWQFNGRTINEDDPRGYKFNKAGQELLIPEFAAARDDGLYFCNVAEFDSFKTLRINVTGYGTCGSDFDARTFSRLERPKILSEIREVVGHESQETYLDCRSVGKPSPTYTWSRIEKGERTALPATNKYSQSADGRLYIYALTQEDAGEYACVVKNDLAEISAKLRLNIFRRPHVDRLPNITLAEEDDLRVNCSFRGDGQITVKWLRSGLLLADVVEDGKHDSRSSSQAGGKKQLGLKKQDSIDYYSDVDDDDDGNARWRRRRQTAKSFVRNVDGTLELHIENVAHDDAGEYKCVAENDAGRDEQTFFLSIERAPVIIRSSSDKRSYTGNRIELVCEAEAVPPPTWSWKRNGEALLANGYGIVVDSEGLVTKLELTTQADEDYGKYACVAENEQGTAESPPIEVIQVVPPATPENVVCNLRSYPNYAICNTNTYDNVAVGHQPTDFEALALRTDNDYNDDWEKAVPSTAAYTGTYFRVAGLEPNARYSIRIRAVNEAGRSELSAAAEAETTNPRSPEPVEGLSVNCTRHCTLSWNPANDNGSPVLAYMISADKDGSNTRLQLTTSANETYTELRELEPSASYRISVVAVNAMGASEPYTVTVTLEGSDSDILGLSFAELAALLLALLVVALLIVDAVVCYPRKRGLFFFIIQLTSGARHRNCKEQTLNGEDKGLLSPSAQTKLQSTTRTEV